jgi:hypothetical protein
MKTNNHACCFSAVAHIDCADVRHNIYRHLKIHVVKMVWTQDQGAKWVLSVIEVALYQTFTSDHIPASQLPNFHSSTSYLWARAYTIAASRQRIYTGSPDLPKQFGFLPSLTPAQGARGAPSRRLVDLMARGRLWARIYVVSMG